MLDLWQFKLCQTLTSVVEDGLSQESVGSVMSPEYLHSVEMSLLSRSEAKGTDNEEELDRLLGHYIRGDQTEMMSPETADLLATVLLLHDIPSKYRIQLNSNSKYLKYIPNVCDCIDSVASNTTRPVSATKITRSISYSSHKASTIATTVTSIAITFVINIIVIQQG